MGEKDDDRDAILKRRQAFVAAALAGLSLTAQGCADSMEPRTEDAGVDAGDPMPCLSAPAPDACLGAPLPMDAGPLPGEDAGSGDAGVDGGADAAPEPCLRVAPDAGSGDAG